ncbi:MAG: hypothetical protein B7Z45_05470 [Azorhizobium sp. 12-66-6]|nr:MAG: hypothetical protein B7Z45_05470 [Azorhizobium sp. 12-66-6]
MTDPTVPPPAEDQPTAPQRGKGRAIVILSAAMLAGAVAGALALYGMNGLSGNAPLAKMAQSESAGTASPAGDALVKDPACAPAVTLANRLKGLATGEVAAFSLASEPRRLPPLSFTDATGAPRTLADFKGKMVLVNLWATWCVPCRKEMPALDQLQQTLGGDNFEVVAINLDTRDPAKPKAFLDEIAVKALAFYADPGTKSFQALRTAGRGFGLPTTLLVDGAGCEVGFLAGPAEWASEDALTLIRGALAGKAG